MILLVQDEAKEVRQLARRAARETDSSRAMALLIEGQAVLAGLVSQLAVALWAQIESAPGKPVAGVSDDAVRARVDA